MSTLDLRNGSAVIDVFERAADAVRNHPGRAGSAVHLPARGRLVVTGDLHDNIDHLRKIVHFARLEQSTDHHLALHELIHGDQLINGMDFSHRTLARIAELITRHPEQVHPLLANHEIAQLTGSGVSKGAGNSVALFNQALEYVFGEEWEVVLEAIRGFIRAMPVALLTGGAGAVESALPAGICVAHSLPNENMMKRFDPDIFQRSLVEVDYHGPFGRAYMMCWGRLYTPAQVEQLARQWNIRLFVLGHQHVPDGADVLGDRVLLLNSDHPRGKVAAIDPADPPDALEALASAIPIAALPE